MAKRLLYFSILLFVFLPINFILAAQEERLTITTYFPSPYGSYKELTSTGNTYLATSSGRTVGIGINVGGTGPQALLQVGTSPDSGLFVRASGNVGIGTTSPEGYKLRVEGNMTVTGLLNTPGTDVDVNAVAGYSGIIGVSRPVTLLRCQITVSNGVIQTSDTTCI
jgi:hypothetical protein